MKLFLKKRKDILHVNFVYSNAYKNSGSTVMRGLQLSKLFRKYSRGHYEVNYIEINDRIKDSVIILTKGSLKASSPDLLYRLRKRGNKLVFDPVDEAIPEELVEHSAAIIASSMTAYKSYVNHYSDKNIFLVNHHVDPRVIAMMEDRPTVGNLKVGYFGELVNTVVSNKIKEYVDFISVDTSTSSPEWIQELPNYNFHYAIRSERSLDEYKPFLKGFTAAYCNANIIIQRSQTEALYWLGNDYPYLINENPTEDEIINKLKYVYESYNSKEWHEALNTMSRIKSDISPSKIVESLEDAILKINTYNS